MSSVPLPHHDAIWLWVENPSSLCYLALQYTHRTVIRALAASTVDIFTVFGRHLCTDGRGVRTSAKPCICNRSESKTSSQRDEYGREMFTLSPTDYQRGFLSRREAEATEKRRRLGVHNTAFVNHDLSESF